MNMLTRIRLCHAAVTSLARTITAASRTRTMNIAGSLVLPGVIVAACGPESDLRDQVLVTSTVSQTLIRFNRVAQDNIILRIVVRNVSKKTAKVPDQPCTDVYYMEQGELDARHRLLPIKFCDGPAVAAFSIAARDSVVFIRNLSEILPKCDVEAGELRIWPQIRFGNDVTRGTLHYLQVD